MSDESGRLRFIRIWPERWGLFRDGVLVCDWRPSGRVYKVTHYFLYSTQAYRTVLVSTQEAARRVCVELAQQGGTD